MLGHASLRQNSISALMSSDLWYNTLWCCLGMYMHISRLATKALFNARWSLGGLHNQRQQELGRLSRPKTAPVVPKDSTVAPRQPAPQLLL